MPVVFSKHITDEAKKLTLWVDDYVLFRDNGLLPPAALFRGYKTYVKRNHVQEILDIDCEETYLNAVREHWDEALVDLVKNSNGYFTSVEDAALWFRTTTWHGVYSIEVLIELGKTWAAETKAAQATLKAMSSPPALTVNGLDTIEEDDDNTASKKRKEAHQKLLGKLRPLPLEKVYNVYHDKYTPDNDDYSGRLHVLEKNIQDIAKFYSVFNNFPWDKVILRDTISFFHSDAKPVWEDPKNIDGGSWTFRVGRSKAKQFFLEMALLNVSGEVAWAVLDDDEVLGFSYSMRANSVLISIWNKRGSNKASVEAIKDVIVERLSPELRPTESKQYFYKKHSEHAGWEDIVRAAGVDESLVKAALGQ